MVAYDALSYDKSLPGHRMLSRGEAIERAPGVAREGLRGAALYYDAQVTFAERLAVEYPGTARELCALHHRNPYELLTATILSAQTTDERVNKVTPELFARYPTPADLAAAERALLREPNSVPIGRDEQTKGAPPP